ncbi:MAG TPA: hypothetical protein VKE71_02845 [Candidatus Angelobacter sp.]|nr:hypothetical protein [Candidatus Angelobacter sp.]
MSSKSILLFLLLFSSAGFTQSTATSPSKKELINELEGATPATPAVSIKKTNESAAQPTAPAKPAADPALGTLAATGLTQNVAPATVLTNNDLLARGKTIFVITDSFFVKKEQLERGLINRKELGDWGLHVVESPQTADLILKVRRAPFQNNFPFTITDRVSGIVVMGGTVNSLFGTVPGKIAARLADKLKEIKPRQ